LIKSVQGDSKIKILRSLRRAIEKEKIVRETFLIDKVLSIWFFTLKYNYLERRWW